MTTTDRTDKTSYAPFILFDDDELRSLILSDEPMLSRCAIFEERAAEGWSGNGDDWGSIARVIVAEQLPEFEDDLELDPEAGMFSASGSRAALEKLGAALAAAFHDDARLRDLLSRAELD